MAHETFRLDILKKTHSYTTMYLMCACSVSNIYVAQLDRRQCVLHENASI